MLRSDQLNVWVSWRLRQDHAIFTSILGDQRGLRGLEKTSMQGDKKQLKSELCPALAGQILARGGHREVPQCRRGTPGCGYHQKAPGKQQDAASSERAGNISTAPAETASLSVHSWHWQLYLLRRTSLTYG